MKVRLELDIPPCEVAASTALVTALTALVTALRAPAAGGDPTAAKDAAEPAAMAAGGADGAPPRPPSHNGPATSPPRDAYRRDWASGGGSDVAAPVAGVDSPATAPSSSQPAYGGASGLLPPPSPVPPGGLPGGGAPPPAAGLFGPSGGAFEPPPPSSSTLPQDDAATAAGLSDLLESVALGQMAPNLAANVIRTPRPSAPSVAVPGAPLLVSAFTGAILSKSAIAARHPGGTHSAGPLIQTLLHLHPGVLAEVKRAVVRRSLDVFAAGGVDDGRGGVGGGGGGDGGGGDAADAVADDRMGLYAHAEAFAALVAVGVVPLGAALKTVTALISGAGDGVGGGGGTTAAAAAAVAAAGGPLAGAPGRPGAVTTRAAGLTLMGKMAEMCGGRLRDAAAGGDADGGVAEGLEELRTVLEGVTEEEFAYDVDYIVDSLGWGEEGLEVGVGG